MRLYFTCLQQLFCFFLNGKPINLHKANPISVQLNMFEGSGVLLQLGGSQFRLVTQAAINQIWEADLNKLHIKKNKKKTD